MLRRKLICLRAGASSIQLSAEGVRKKEKPSALVFINILIISYLYKLSAEGVCKIEKPSALWAAEHKKNITPFTMRYEQGDAMKIC